MPKLTIDTCKAPTFDEFPKLAKIHADKVFDAAVAIKEQIARLEDELRALGPKIQAKLDVGVDDPEVNSIRYGSLLITKRRGYERRSLDKKWAVKKLIALKVKQQEIDDHMDVAVIEPGISLQLLGEGTEEGE